MPADLSDAAAVLDAREAEVRAQLGDIEVASAEQTAGGIGFGKRVGDSTSMAVERITDVAKQENLLAKLDEGSYGRCDVCDVPIDAERLEFRPYATRCVEHAG